MGKVSIGLRGWRFDEDEVFDDGELRPLARMEPDTRQRIVRLSSLVTEPCDACYLVHGEDDIERCRKATVVYGEPLGEVLLCDDHEPDFLYWFREGGGSRYRGGTELRNAFHEWFADGGRAPDGYAGLDHVERAPGRIPTAGERAGALPSLEEELDEMDEAELDALELDLDELDV